jgi:dolichol kinase
MFGWLALALGDGLAGLVGPSPSRTRTVPWNRHKTRWGSFGCFIGAFAAYCGTNLLLDLVYLPAEFAWGPLLLRAGIAGAAVALAESMEIGLDDNYVVGIAACLVGLLLALFR